MPERHHRHTPRHGQPWTAQEDRVAIEAMSDLRGVAARLGRTTAAVMLRRDLLRRRARRAA